MKDVREKSIPFLYAGCVAVMFLLVHGYQFNRGDLSEHLPQVYRALSPDIPLYRGDFFLGLYDQTFTVREYWVLVVTFLSRFAGAELTCFLLHLGCIYITVLAWMKISIQVTGNKWSQYISPVLIFLVFNSFTVGGNQLQGPAFVSSIPAEALASAGILLWLKEKRYYAALLFGLATLFQALVGLQWCVLVCAVQLFSPFSFKSLKRTFFTGAIYLAAASPLLIPVLMRQAVTGETYDQALYYRILYIYRNYLHYIPSLFPVKDYIMLGVLLTGGVICMRYQKFNARILMTRALMITMIAGCIVYWLLLEVFGIEATGKLQWFKTTVWLNAFCCVLIGGLIVQLKGIYIEKYTRYNITGAAMIFLILSGIFILTQSALLPERLKYRYQVGNAGRTARQDMHEWICMNTPADALFLVAPSNDAFTCEAQRPTVANYKAVVHEPFFFIEWYKVLQDYYHVDFNAIGRQSAFASAQLNYETILAYPQGNKAQYRLDDTEHCAFTDKLGPVIHREGNWLLTQIR